MTMELRRSTLFQSRDDGFGEGQNDDDIFTHEEVVVDNSATAVVKKEGQRNVRLSRSLVSASWDLDWDALINPEGGGPGALFGSINVAAASDTGSGFLNLVSSIPSATSPKPPATSSFLAPARSDGVRSSSTLPTTPLATAVLSSSSSAKTRSQTAKKRANASDNASSAKKAKVTTQPAKKRKTRAKAANVVAVDYDVDDEEDDENSDEEDFGVPRKQRGGSSSSKRNSKAEREAEEQQKKYEKIQQRVMQMSFNLTAHVDAKAQEQCRSAALLGKSAAETADETACAIVTLHNGVVNKSITKAAAKSQALKRLQDCRALEQRLVSAKNSVATVRSTYMLAPRDYFKVLSMEMQLNRFALQLKLYIDELEFLRSYPDRSPGAKVALAIAEDNFPRAFMYRKVAPQIVVRVLRGALTDCRLSPIRCAVLCDAVSQKKKGEIELKNNGKKENRDHLAVFSDLIIQTGSQKSPAHAKFICTVTPSNGGKSFTVESERSRPFCCLTHESQWSETTGKLFRLTLFKSLQSSSPPPAGWNLFSNELQQLLLRASKQSTEIPTRVLSSNELNHLRELFFGSKTAETVSLKHFHPFWEFIGPCLYRLHYKKHLSTMWERGLIAGFVSRQEAERVVKLSEQPNTAFIRWSSSCAGQFVITYRKQTGGVNHLLVDAQYTDERLLPDSLRDWPFTHIFTVQDSGTQDVISFTEVNKNDVLKDLYSKRKAKLKSSTSGYISEPV